MVILKIGEKQEGDSTSRFSALKSKQANDKNKTNKQTSTPQRNQGKHTKQKCLSQPPEARRFSPLWYLACYGSYPISSCNEEQASCEKLHPPHFTENMSHCYGGPGARHCKSGVMDTLCAQQNVIDFKTQCSIGSLEEAYRIFWCCG